MQFLLPDKTGRMKLYIIYSTMIKIHDSSRQTAGIQVSGGSAGGQLPGRCKKQGAATISLLGDASLLF
jgi:hypothetical protein